MEVLHHQKSKKKAKMIKEEKETDGQDKHRVQSISERRHHFLGCQLIAEANAALSFPPQMALSAQNIYHRFFQRKSVEKYDNFTMAMAAFFLACKTAEQRIVLRDVIFAFHKLLYQHKALPFKVLELGSELYAEWKQELIATELIVLRELGFKVYAGQDIPHNYLPQVVAAATTFSQPSGPEVWLQVSVNYLNDSMYGNLFLRYDLLYIAVAAVVLAMQQTLSDTDCEERRRLLLLVFHLDPDILLEIMEEVRGLYTLMYGSKDGTSSITWLDPVSDVPYLRKTLTA